MGEGARLDCPASRYVKKGIRTMKMRTLLFPSLAGHIPPFAHAFDAGDDGDWSYKFVNVEP